MSKEIKNETKEVNKVEDNNVTNKDVIANKDTVKVEIKEGKQLNKYSQYANYSQNQLKANQAFLNDAAVDTQNAITKLSIGENPSGKYLVQHILTNQAGDKSYTNFLNAIYSNVEFIPNGQGSEYVLFNGLAVNTFDETKFIPEERNDLDNYTYVDNINLSVPGANTPHVELSVALWKYIPYYLSGKIDEVASNIINMMKPAMGRKIFKSTIEMIEKAYTKLYAKTSSTAAAPTNHLVSAADSALDAMKNLKDFIFNMYSDNTTFNYGTDTGDYTDAYNNVSRENLVLICDYNTYNALNAYTTIFQNVDAVKAYLGVSELIALPKTFYDNETSSAKEKGSIKDLLIFKDNDGNRVKGTILILDKRNIKMAYNWDFISSQSFIKNATTQYVYNYNYGCKILKWAQCALFSDPALENPVVFPVKTK